MIILSMVINNLGAATDTMTSSITVNSIGAGNRRGLDPATKTSFDQILTTISSANLAGRSDYVNQFSYSFASELDSAYNSSRIGSVDAGLYRQNLTLSILQSVFTAILTVGYAEEASSSISRVDQNPAQLRESLSCHHPEW